MIRACLADGEWHARRELGEKFDSRMSQGRYLQVKKSLGIEHCQKGGRFYWRFPT